MQRLIEISSGTIEVFLDKPVESPRGIALVAHPQPLLGGSAEHKIPQLLAKAVLELGWIAVRPNFRGVGASSGKHDAGIGEVDDLFELLRMLRAEFGSLPVALIGFSFGAFVQAGVAGRMARAGHGADHVILAGFPVGHVEGQRHYAPEPLPAGALLVHGEFDERVPLEAVLQWARQDVHPVTVIPGADHFFKGKLAVLRALVVAHMKPR
ncbi:alpha/beta hydrolase [Variovorax sp. J22G21]|uniref:alpha/beta hydrolase n=1 Tax=Variovorax fucosicus TaxID=3053517 RepID=UPI002576EBD7|nr:MULTISPECIES: alpha/beta hydrolase [unclassified Variovorax]MDM0037731.1 alpha/beta hydrolase [Variovorax sp. J22R193]MDM0062507.1 alpha/beta hydrolase [Variovorax sp. J22G21]